MIDINTCAQKPPTRRYNASVALDPPVYCRSTLTTALATATLRLFSGCLWPSPLPRMPHSFSALFELL